MSYETLITPERAKVNTKESRKRDKEYALEKLKREDDLWKQLDEAITLYSSDKEDHCSFSFAACIFADKYKVSECDILECFVRLVKEKGFECTIDQSHHEFYNTQFIISWGDD